MKKMFEAYREYCKKLHYTLPVQFAGWATILFIILAMFVLFIKPELGQINVLLMGASLHEVAMNGMILSLVSFVILKTVYRKIATGSYF